MAERITELRTKLDSNNTFTAYPIGAEASNVMLNNQDLATIIKSIRNFQILNGTLFSLLNTGYYDETDQILYLLPDYFTITDDGALEAVNLT